MGHQSLTISDAYTKDQVVYVWKHGTNRSIKMSDDLRLSQFDLTGTQAGNATVNNRIGKGNIKITFMLESHIVTPGDAVVK